jgi:anti-sigma-K factor RskA
MTDYKNQCNWRRNKMLWKQKKAAQAIMLTVIAVLVYGFVGYLEQEPVVVEAHLLEAR